MIFLSICGGGLSGGGSCGGGSCGSTQHHSRARHVCIARDFLGQRNILSRPLPPAMLRREESLCRREIRGIGSRNTSGWKYGNNARGTKRCLRFVPCSN